MKTPQQWDSESFRVGEQTHQGPGGRMFRKGWKLHAPSPLPCIFSTGLFLTSLSPHITQTKFLVSAPERMVAPFLYSWQEALPQTGEDKITEPLAPLVSVCLWVRSSVLGAAS